MPLNCCSYHRKKFKLWNSIKIAFGNAALNLTSFLQIDQPSLALPRDFYLDTEGSYDEYIQVKSKFYVHFEMSNMMVFEKN